MKFVYHILSLKFKNKSINGFTYVNSLMIITYGEVERKRDIRVQFYFLNRKSIKWESQANMAKHEHLFYLGHRYLDVSSV